MSNGYFVSEPFGEPVSGKSTGRISEEERRNAILSVSTRALEIVASMHTSEVTDIIMLTLQGVDKSIVKKKLGFFKNLGVPREIAVRRFLISMTDVRYHQLFSIDKFFTTSE